MSSPQKYLIQPAHQKVTDNIEQLLAVLPPEITRNLIRHSDLMDLLEIVLDLGREPEARFPNDVYTILDRPVTEEDIEYVATRVGAFGADNRAGIERTLHRISAIRNRSGRIVGLTCRIGRAVYGTVDIIRDVVEKGKSVLLLGRPGVGKCVIGDTLIPTEHGIIPIASLQPDIPADTEGFREMRCVVAGPEGPVTAERFYNGGRQATIRITTTLGYVLEGTPEHPVIARTPSGEPRFTRLDTLRSGDEVALVRGRAMFGAHPMTPDSAAVLGARLANDPDASIPPEVLKAPKETVLALIRSLFDAVGEVGEDCVTAVFPSAELAGQAHVLLLALGMVTNRHRRWCDGGHIHSITLLGDSLRCFASEIGFSDDRANADLQRAAEAAARESECVLGRLIDPPCAMGADILFDDVAVIEHSHAEVYDLSVPEGHTFIGGGFINHNTTKLREVARILSEEFHKRVVIVDTSNEIAGDGDIPHPAIGRARRMQVPTPSEQHAVMIEAVENHMPEVIVIDEIGTEQEAFASRTIAERGVQLVGTAHGNSLENLMMNPTLSDLIGGIQAVTLSDDEARRRGTQKTVLERKAPPTFDVIIEILEVDKLAIHHDVMSTVDRMLRGASPRPEIRVRTSQGEVEVVQKGESAPVTNGEPRVFETSSHPHTPAAQEYQLSAPREIPPATRIYSYGVSRNRLERAIRELRLPVYITKDLNEANAVIALKAHTRGASARLQDAINRGLPMYVVRSNTYAQVASALRDMFHLPADSTPDEEELALQEARESAERVHEFGEPVELNPQNSYLRRLQHELIQTFGLSSDSIGAEPNRRVRVSKR